jgi:hypothetical protein
MQRYQIIRKKDRHIPSYAVNVTRQGAWHGKWGNPFVVVKGDRATAVQSFVAMIEAGNNPPFTTAIIRRELAGRSLACVCPIGQPCHADVLLAVANSLPSQ